mmetsp:Transcript_11137/g.17200  ORF Transcript_11137/g.17200 Transcript_11137/m.17200 type:complete len:208 (+) Transcript_11137:1283-1906(+)
MLHTGQSTVTDIDRTGFDDVTTSREESKVFDDCRTKVRPPTTTTALKLSPGATRKSVPSPSVSRAEMTRQLPVEESSHSPNLNMASKFDIDFLSQPMTVGFDVPFSIWAKILSNERSVTFARVTGCSLFPLEEPRMDTSLPKRRKCPLIPRKGISALLLFISSISLTALPTAFAATDKIERFILSRDSFCSLSCGRSRRIFFIFTLK